MNGKNILIGLLMIAATASMSGCLFGNNDPPTVIVPTPEVHVDMSKVAYPTPSIVVQVQNPTPSPPPTATTPTQATPPAETNGSANRTGNSVNGGNGNIDYFEDATLMNLPKVQDTVYSRVARGTVSFDMRGDSVTIIVTGNISGWNPGREAVATGNCRLVEAFGNSVALLGGEFPLVQTQQLVWQNSRHMARLEVLNDPATGRSTEGTTYCEMRLVDLSGSSGSDSGGNNNTSGGGSGTVPGPYTIPWQSGQAQSFTLNPQGSGVTGPISIQGVSSQVTLTCSTPSSGTVKLFKSGDYANSNNGANGGWTIPANSQSLSGVGPGFQLWFSQGGQTVTCSWTT